MQCKIKSLNQMCYVPVRHEVYLLSMSLYYLPALGVVLPEALAKVLVPAGLRLFQVLVQVRSLWMLLYVLQVGVCSVSALEDSSRRRVLLLTFPEKVATQTRRQFSGEHVSACRLW